MIAGAIPLLLASRLSQPDALQIATCRDIGGVLVSADARLVREARAERLTAFDPAVDAEALRALP